MVSFFVTHSQDKKKYLRIIVCTWPLVLENNRKWVGCFTLGAELFLQGDIDIKMPFELLKL